MHIRIRTKVTIFELILCQITLSSISQLIVDLIIKELPVTSYNEIEMIVGYTQKMLIVINTITWKFH